MSKILRTAAFIVGAVALTVATAGIGAAPAVGAAGFVGGGTAAFAGAAAVSAGIAGISAGTLTLVATGLSLAAGLTAKKPSGGVGGGQTAFKADPDAGIPYLIGRTGTGGNIVFHQAADGFKGKTNNDLGDFVTVLSLGPVDEISSYAINKSVVTFDGAGNAVGGYRDFLFYKDQLGALPEASALAVVAGSSPRPYAFGPTYKLSGLAAAMSRYRFDTKNKKYPNGTPQPLWIVKGVKCYDPRRDSTYPGGLGGCRAGDESTYIWSENPYIHGLTWCLGRYQNGLRVMGAGVPISGIDVAAFVEGANIADTNGWKVGGVVYSTDNKYDVLKQMLQAGSGEPMRLGAKISCLVNAPRVSLATVTVGDVVGEVSVTATQAQRDRINGVIPRYRSEGHDWEIVPAEPVRVASYVTVDGGQRTKEIEYSLCQNVNQAATLARYDIENAREFGPVTLPLKLRWMGYRPGDCITVNLPEVGLASQTVLLLNRSLEPATGIVTMTARSETPAKHPYALGQTGVAPDTPSVAGPPLVPTPTVDEWAITALALSGSGVTHPALVVTGTADPSIIDAIIFEYRVYSIGLGDDDGWIAAGTETPDAMRCEITSVTSEQQYQVSIRYTMRSAAGARLILGPVSTAQWEGIKGEDGAPGINGADGQTFYTWIAYADAADGSVNFTTGTPGDRAYIGIAPNKTTATEGSNPADYTWSAYKGPPNFGLVVGAGCIISGNKIIKTAAVGWGNSSAYSSEAWTGAAQVSARAGSTTANMMFGLNTDPNTDSNFVSLDYAWQFTASGTLSIYESGTGGSVYGTYTTDTVLSIQYDGKNVYYYADGILKRTVAATTGQKFYLDTAFNTTGAVLYITSFGAAGAAGADGADGAPGDSVDIIFRRATSQPATPSPSAGVPSGWYGDAGSVPSGAGAIYSSVGTKPGAGANYTWQTPIKIEGSDGTNGTDGTNGSPGLSIAELMIWQRAASAPDTPTGGSYNFGTKVLTPPTGWTSGVPSGDDPAYVSRAVASIAGTTGTATPGAWSAPVLSLKNGTDGANAISVSAAPEAITVGCDFAGNPKSGSLPVTSQLQAIVGTDDKTESCTYAVAATSDCSATVSTHGLITISSIAADSAYVDVTVSFGGASVTKRVTLSKSYDGASGSSVVGAGGLSSSTTYADTGDVLTLAVGPNGTLSASCGVLGASVATSTFTAGYRILYRQQGGTWATLATVTQTVTNGESLALFCSGSVAGPSTLQVYEVKLQSYRSSGFSGGVSARPFSASWKP